MSGVEILGVYVSPVTTACLVALVLTAALSLVLTRIGFYRLVWHRPLVEVCLFCMLLALVGLAPKIGLAP